MKAAHGLTHLISKLEIETSLHACLNKLYVETAIYCIISKEHGVSSADLIEQPVETQKLLVPTPKHSPAAYARIRSSAYGSVPEPPADQGLAKRLKGPDVVLCDVETQTLTEPTEPLQKPEDPALMVALAENWWPNQSDQPYILSIEEGDPKQSSGVSSVEASLQYFAGHDQPICAMLDAQVGAVFVPIPGVLLGGEAVYKSEQGFYFWCYDSTPEEAKPGWYLSSVLWQPGTLSSVNTDISS